MNDQNVQNEAPLAGIGELPRSVEPSRDLWPAIQARLDEREVPAPPRRRWALHAVAASLALAFVAGLLVGRQAPEGPGLPMPGAIGVDELAGPAMVAGLQAAELEFQAAWKGLPPVSMGQPALSLEAEQSIQGSWEELQQAETALLAALEEHPDNPYLGQKLLDLRAQQLQFLRQLHMLDQNSRRST